MKNKIQGISLLEILLALLIFFFIISGLTKGLSDILKLAKRTELQNIARQILETEKGKFLNQPLINLNLYDIQLHGTCSFNGTCSFEEACFNSTQLNRTFCLQGKQLVATNNCSSSYVFNLKKAFAIVYPPDPENSTQYLSSTPIGIGLCLKVEFPDPLTNATQTYQALVLKME